MKREFNSLLRKFSFLIIGLVFSMFALNAQTMEKLIVYENFGGLAAGSSVTGIQPHKWPDVHADSATNGGWSASEQNLDNKGGLELVYQFHGNGYAHIDTIDKNKTGGISGLGISVNATTKKWENEVTLRNGYQMPFTNAPTVDFGFLGAAVLPEFSSWISYASYTPDYLKNQTDEIGSVYTGKNVDGRRPEITIPSNPIDVFENLSKIEILFSGSRLGQNNTLSVTLEEQNSAGTTIGTETFTFSATIEPRLVTIPSTKQYIRIHIDTWGSANNANVTDFALLNNNTEVDTWANYNYNAIEGVKPDGSTTGGQTGNPGISMHMIKVYAKMSGAGYSITTDNGLVSGTTSGISYGANTTLTAAATNVSAKNFVGWNIDGKPDLSEVVNPLTISVTEDMTIMPVYVDDVVELAVVDENFTNWMQVGTTLPDRNNSLDYSQGAPNVGNMLTGTQKVALRHGFTSGGEDSVEIDLVKCNVIPQYGLRVFNAPGWEDALGYIAFMGPNDDKGYLTVDSLDGITKALLTLSSYDQPAPDRACAILINDDIVRNKTLRTMYAEEVEITTNPANPVELQIGPGNQARVEYLDNSNPESDIFSKVSAAAVALHNIKMYAEVTLTDLTYYKLTTPATTNGVITGIVPSAGNSTKHYASGTEVSLSAQADVGYGFDGWFDATSTLISKENPIHITMNADKTVKPVFSISYSYIELADNSKGDVSPSAEPYEVDGETYTFLAGNALQLTADPVYGFEFAKWVLNGDDQMSNPLSLSSSQMVSEATNVISVVYDSITARQSIAIEIDTLQGNISFNHEPEGLNFDGDSLRGLFPTGVEIQLTVNDGYSYAFARWKQGDDIDNADTANSVISVVMDKDIKLAVEFEGLPRNLLVINQANRGTLEITDPHKDGAQELLGLWPQNHSVELTATPDNGYELISVGEDVNAFINGNFVKVKMDQDTVTVNPEWVTESSYLTLKHNFQDPQLWPMHPDNVSNVPGARIFLEKPDTWDPTTYNQDLEALLTELAPYRVWGSESNDNSDGPGGTKNPMTTLLLNYTKDTLVATLDISNSQQKATVVNYSNCNDCVIAKAVKGQNVDNYYLGHVTPGMLALQGLGATDRKTTDGPAFRANDSIGMMVIEGFVYVENVEVGYVTSTAQFCPGVFFTTDSDLEIINNQFNFAGGFGELWPLGQDFKASARPDQGEYGWGSAQEGMIMDKGMAVAEVDVPETKIIITSGYKSQDEDYYYSTVYIHDLKIVGSPKDDPSFIHLIKYRNLPDSKFYMLGNSNLLQLEINEPVKTVVIYDMNGRAVKVIQNIDNYYNQVELESLKQGVYGIHCYGQSGKLHTGIFAKPNN